MEYVLHYKSVHLLIIVFLVVLVIFGQVPGQSQFSAVLQNCCHAPAFFILTSSLLALLKRRRLSFLIAFAGAVGIGSLIEIVQGLIGGDASILDVCSDGVGALASLAFWGYRDQRLKKGSAYLLISACAAYWIAPLIWCLCAYANRVTAFPTIAKFSTPLDTYFLRSDDLESRIETLPFRWSHGNNDKGLLITFSRGPWPGIELEEPQPNWTGFHSLNVEMTNPNPEPVALTIRVDDLRHNNQFDDRFNHQLTVTANKRLTFSIPITAIERAPRARLMDMKHIKSLKIFSDQRFAGMSMFVNRLWLE